MKIKYLKDLEGWTQTGLSMSSIWLWHEGYTVFTSPDEKRIAPVDMNDEEVTLIFNRETKKLEYVHPTTELGMRRVGITREYMEDVLARRGV